MWGTQPELTAEINRVFRQRHPINIDADFYPQILVRPSSHQYATTGESGCHALTIERSETLALSIVRASLCVDPGFKKYILFAFGCR